MLDHLRIKDKISEIRRRIAKLERIGQTTDEESFLEDSHFVASAAERNLEVAIQACLDIASHITAKMALEKPKVNKELFIILAQHKIIREDLSKRLVFMTGMRNILVHEYLDIEREKIYQALKNDLKDMVEFVRQIEVFLEKHNNV